MSPSQAEHRNPLELIDEILAMEMEFVKEVETLRMLHQELDL